VERASIPARTAAKLYRMPDIDKDYVNKNLTDNSKVVIKTKEIADTSSIKKKLEAKGDPPQLPLHQQQNQQSQEITSSTFSLQSKEKLKHLCKKIGHSKIIGKMVALQCAANTDVDEGTTKLVNRSNTEEEYFNIYKAGKVESKVQHFESEGVQPLPKDEQPQWAQGGKYAFSWSKRFGAFLPVPSECYTNAQKHNQFRKYYGYHPGDGHQRSISPQRHVQFENINEPKSLPVELSSAGIPPLPPERRQFNIGQSNENLKESIYGKIVPKGESEGVYILNHFKDQRRKPIFDR